MIVVYELFQNTIEWLLKINFPKIVKVRTVQNPIVTVRIELKAALRPTRVSDELFFLSNAQSANGFRSDAIGFDRTGSRVRPNGTARSYKQYKF